MEPRDVFISHAEEDWPIGRTLAVALRAQHLSVWTYEEDGIPGVSHLEQTSRAIEVCRAFVLLASPKSVKAHQVIREVEEAHEAEKVIIAVRLGLSHQEFVASNRILRMACGTAVTLAMKEENFREVAKRIAATLRFAQSQKPPLEREPVKSPHTVTVAPATAPMLSPRHGPSSTNAEPALSLGGGPALPIQTTEPRPASVLRTLGRVTSGWLWLSIWLSIFCQIAVASLEMLLNDFLLWIIPSIAKISCGLGMAWTFAKLRRAVTVSRGRARLLNSFLTISLLAVFLPLLFLPSTYRFRGVFVTGTELFGVSCIALIWNGLRVLRKASVEG